MGYFFAQHPTFYSSSAACNDLVNSLRASDIGHCCFMGCSCAPNTCPFCHCVNMGNICFEEPVFWKIISSKVFTSSSEAQTYCDLAAAILPMDVCDVSDVVQQNGTTSICCRPFPFEWLSPS